MVKAEEVDGGNKYEANVFEVIKRFLTEINIKSEKNKIISLKTLLVMRVEKITVINRKREFRRRKFPRGKFRRR